MIAPMAGYAAKPLTPSPLCISSAFRNLSITPKRTFSSTPATLGGTKLFAGVPPYPYGPRRFFKQADSGLYGGAIKQFGHKISKGRNKGKTLRSWSPNIRREKLYSEALDEHLEIKVRHRVMRTIKKVGGLDQYILGDKPARIKELGIFGWNLRWKIMKTQKIREQFEQERRALGIQTAPQSFKEFMQQKEEEMEQQQEEPAEELEEEPEVEQQQESTREHQEAPPMKG